MNIQGRPEDAIVGTASDRKILGQCIYVDYFQLTRWRELEVELVQHRSVEHA